MSATRREKQLILASASPRRLQLLEAAGFIGKVEPAKCAEAEKRPQSIPIPLWPIFLAFTKAFSVQQHLKTNSVILGADTIVVLGEKILNKPRDKAHARKMLGELSGKRHQVITGVAILQGNNHRLFGATAECHVKKLPTPWLEAYLESGRWQGKAGGYGLQDKGDPFVTLIAGDPTTVIGLPMSIVTPELLALGVKRVTSTARMK
jgi:septum formation protein